MTNPIPIQNIYYLLCYAWDVLPSSGLVDIEKDKANTPMELLAQVLINGTHHLMRQGIEEGYQSHTEVINTIRGRCLFSQSARRMLLNQGLTICEFDELSPNTLPNQILKASLFRLSRLWGLDTSLRHQCGKLVRKFHSVDDVKLIPQIFHRLHIHGNNRYYRFLNHICELIYHESLLDEKTGKYRFRDFYRDKGRMAKLYEKFIFNYYKKSQSEYKVSSDRIKWTASSESDPNLEMLPSMLTDISLRSADRTLIIDAKYYSKTLQEFHGKQKINSGNLYQIYAYLKNLEKNVENDAEAAGMLLYPVVTNDVSQSYTIDGHIIRIETINLSQDWQLIENKLLSII